MANGDTKLRFEEKLRHMVMLNKLGRGKYVIFKSLSTTSVICKNGGMLHEAKDSFYNAHASSRSWSGYDGSICT